MMRHIHQALHKSSCAVAAAIIIIISVMVTYYSSPKGDKSLCGI